MRIRIERSEPGTSRGGLTVALAGLVALAACAAAVYYGLAWQRDSDDTSSGSSAASAESAAARDAVLDDARKATVALTSLDAATPDRSIASWKEATTGSLLDAVSTGQGDFQKLIVEGKVDSAAQVKEAAVQSLDVAAGTARVLVAIDVTLTPAKGQAKVENLRLAVTMSRTDTGWKASELETVAS